jgi:hypothetical protein
MPSSSNPLVVPHKQKTKDNFHWPPFCYCDSTNTFPEQKLHIFQDLLPCISQGTKVGGLIVASASQVHTCVCQLLLLSVKN